MEDKDSWLIFDSELSLEEALRGKDIPQEVIETLMIVNVRYRSFDGYIHQGQLVVHRDVAQETAQIFSELLEINFPIGLAKPVSEYDWDDENSMQANNSSAFNYRTIAGTDKLSKHASGLAIDINPRINPAIHADGTVEPEGAEYDSEAEGALTPDSEAVAIFKKYGWIWGGDWGDPKDYQHFEKKTDT